MLTPKRTGKPFKVAAEGNGSACFPWPSCTTATSIIRMNAVTLYVCVQVREEGIVEDMNVKIMWFYYSGSLINTKFGCSTLIVFKRMNNILRV